MALYVEVITVFPAPAPMILIPLVSTSCLSYVAAPGGTIIVSPERAEEMAARTSAKEGLAAVCVWPERVCNSQKQLEPIVIKTIVFKSRVILTSPKHPSRECLFIMISSKSDQNICI